MSRAATSSAARTRGASDPLSPVTLTWSTATRRESRSHSQPTPSSGQDAHAGARRAGGRAARKREGGQGHPAACFDARVRIPTLVRRAAERTDDPAPGRPRGPLRRGRQRGRRHRGRGRGRSGGRAAARAGRRVEPGRRRRGLPGHRGADRHPRRRTRRRGARGRGRRAMGPARGRLRRARAGGRRVPGRASRDRSAPRRSRTSAPTARRWPRRSPPCACSTAPTARVRRLDPGGMRLHLPLERVQARARALGGARGALRAGGLRALGADPLRRAGAGARASRSARGRRRPRCARRCWRCAAARGWCSTPATPTPSRRARSSPTRCSTPARSPPCRSEPRSDWAPTSARRPGRRTTGRSRRRPPGSSSAPAFIAARATPRASPSPTKHTLALTNRGAGTTAELVALAREIADGVHDAFGVALVPEPVFVGHRW